MSRQLRSPAPRARSAQCPRQFTGILHASPSLRRFRSHARDADHVNIQDRQAGIVCGVLII